jgi:hypothetical protein
VVVLTWLVNWALARGKALGLGVVAIFGRKRVGFGWVSKDCSLDYIYVLTSRLGITGLCFFCEKKEEVTRWYEWWEMKLIAR